MVGDSCVAERHMDLVKDRQTYLYRRHHAMRLEDVVTFWKQQNRPIRGVWIHPADAELLFNKPHSFNLDFPAGPYVGDILQAPVVILGANAGYSSNTAREFQGRDSIRKYLARTASPSDHDWTATGRPYYEERNYGRLLFDGRAVLINACAYRSPRISSERDNQEIVKHLPSVKYTRCWLLECVIPLAEMGKRFVVAKRGGLWRLPKKLREANGVVFDPAPISPDITRGPMMAVEDFLSRISYPWS